MRARILNASAGSGKTYRLAYNYVRDVVWQPMLYRHILAVTFTNKATEEMKSRILKEIHLLASNQKSDYLSDLERDLGLDAATIRQRAKRAESAILHDYSHFSVLTIDKFFQRILHAFLKELGIELNYNIELESAPVLQRGVDTLIERIVSSPEIKEWIEAFAHERIDEHEGWDLRGDILKLGREIFKEGSRSALGGMLPRAELERLVQRTNSQARESQQAFQQLAQEAVELIHREGLTLNDFSNKQSGGCAYFFKVASGEFSEPKKRARECASTWEKGWMERQRAKTLQPLLQELQRRMADLCDHYDRDHSLWNSNRLLKEHYRSFALLSDLYEEVQRIWREENTMLLSETKHILSAFIEENDTPFIYEKVGTRYDRYLIDEFQDTSKREWLNFLPLLQDALSHPTQLATQAGEEPGESVLLVGDIKQSIYRWRGGDWRILGSEAEAALKEVEVEPMSRNFRSFRQVVQFNNEAINQVVNVINGRLNTLLQESGLSMASRRDLEGLLEKAYRGQRQTPCKQSQNGGYISVETFLREPPLVERVCALLDRGFQPCDLMILVRSARDGAKAAQALLAFKQRNNEERYRFDVMTQDALQINASPLCNFIISLLRLAVNPADSLARAICNRYLERAFDAPLPSDERLLLDRLRQLSPDEAVEQIIRSFRLHEKRDQIAYLQALHEQVIHFSQGRIADIPLFLTWWEEHGGGRSLTIEQSRRTIEITTIHRAKGLERKVVIIPYCSWSLEPRSTGEVPNIIWAEAQGSLAEAGQVPIKYRQEMAHSQFSEAYYRELIYSHIDNVNLLYVALTRAVEQLHVFIPASRAGIGGYLWEGIQRLGEEARIGAISGVCQPLEEGNFRCTFGSFDTPEPAKKEEQKEQQRIHQTLEEYPSVRANPSKRLPTAKFQERGGEIEFSPRNFGIRMHRLFEQATNRQEVERALWRLQQEGLLSPEEVEDLHQRVEQVLSDPVAASWYDEPWDRVLSEREIIRPRTDKERMQMKRPDRVMIRGERAVVVDYKFGHKASKAYREQIRYYMNLLKQMGYSQVEGWLWYVTLGRTERVEAEEMNIT